jgi:hypothetical protein
LKYVLCAIPLLMVTTCGVWRLAPATFTLKNGSGQPIRSLTIEVAGKTFRYQDIPPGGTVSGSFRVQQEESLLIEGRLADGTEFAESHGYVVWEDFAPHIDVVVRPGGRVARP